jgi:hypothetical protein
MPERRQLNGWKEISEYFQVSTKAAINWEQSLGMPVHRMPGKKGRVWAFADELDAWKRQAPDETEAPYEIIAPVQNPLRSRRLAVLLAFVLVLSVAVGLWASKHYFMKSRPVVSFKFGLKTLSALDGEGRTVWEYEFQKPFRPPEAEHLARSASTFDLDGNGLPEVLFRYIPVEEHGEVARWTLYCFSPEGKVRWQFIPGRAVTDGAGQFEPPYFINNFQVIPDRRSEGPWIAVSSNHYLSHPDQVAILDRDGKMVGEYWHSGHLTAMTHADLDGDGIDELLLGGVDNGLFQAVLLVFDPRKVSGANHYASDNTYQLQGFSAGSEKAVVMFPQSDINVQEHFSQIFSLRTTPDRILASVTESRLASNLNIVYYELDYHLGIAHMERSPQLVMAHDELRKKGVLNHPWNDSELLALKQAVAVKR